MKITGIILAVLGVLMILSGINLALTQYDLHSSHDLSKWIGSMGISLGLLVVGLILYRKGSAK